MHQSCETGAQTCPYALAVLHASALPHASSSGHSMWPEFFPSMFLKWLVWQSWCSGGLGHCNAAHTALHWRGHPQAHGCQSLSHQDMVPTSLAERANKRDCIRGCLGSGLLSRKCLCSTWRALPLEAKLGMLASLAGLQGRSCRAHVSQAKYKEREREREGDREREKAKDKHKEQIKEKEKEKKAKRQKGRQGRERESDCTWLSINTHDMSFEITHAALFLNVHVLLYSCVRGWAVANLM